MDITLPVAEQIFGVVITGLSVGPLKGFIGDDFVQGKVVLGVFIFFALLHIGLFIYVRRQILLVNNQTSFTYSKRNISGVETVQIKVVDYDLEECDKGIKGLLFTFVIAFVFYFKFNNASSLISNCISIIKPLLLNGLVREYVYGKSIGRPFDKVSIFGKYVDSQPESVSSSTRSERRQNKRRERTAMAQSSPAAVEEIIENDVTTSTDDNQVEDVTSVSTEKDQDDSEDLDEIKNRRPSRKEE